MSYTNDTLLFCKDNDSMLITLRRAVELFEWISGQKVNQEKSTFCGISMEEDKLVSMASQLNCKIERLPFLYLGLPLGSFKKTSHILAIGY